jgi:acyl-CoA dehydrogenase
MRLVLTDEQQMIRTAARDFVAGRSSLRRVRGLRDAGGFSRELWREMAHLGWLGLTAPEAHGGSGAGHVAQMLVLEELGRGLCPEPFVSTVLLGQTAFLLGGGAGEEVAASVAGERLLALAEHERGARFELDRVSTSATPAGSGFALRGAKRHVLGGASADVFVIPARLGASVELFVVRAGTAGLEVSAEGRLDGRDAALVELHGAEVPASAQLSGGLALLERVIDRATIGLCAEMLGAAEAAFAMTLEYLKTRVQFGVPIGSFQALQHRAAKIYVELELARSAVWRAHALLDEPEPADDAAVARAASIAKAKLAETALLVAHEAVQMHGGIGMTEEHDVGLFLKRARVAEMTFGDAGWHHERFARLSGF